jgi:cytochrome c peroxidase
MAGCASCHPEPLFTDQKSYDVGTANRLDGTKRAFDTPTLVESWRTAPYLHDGSAASLEAAIRANRDDQHGKTSELSPSELEDLVTYVLSL